MKSSKFTLAAMAVMLAFGTAAYAKGAMNGQAGGAGAGTSAGTGTGMHARTGDPGTGTQTRTQTQERTQLQAEEKIRARLHTMSADRVPAAGAVAGTGAQRGIHTPGTGLTTTSTDGTVAVAQ